MKRFLYERFSKENSIRSIYVVSRVHMSTSDGSTSGLDADFFNRSARLFTSLDFPAKNFTSQAEAEKYLKSAGGDYGIFIIPNQNDTLAGNETDFEKISGNRIEKLILSPFSPFRAKDNIVNNPGFDNKHDTPKIHPTNPLQKFINIFIS